MTEKRSWLVLQAPENTAKDVAKAIWNKYKGKSFKPDQNLKKGWLVRADVLGNDMIMVPVVGVAKKNAANSDPIDVILEKITSKHGVTLVHRYDVGQHNPSVGSGNDYPPDPSAIVPAPRDERPLNGWG